MPYRTKSFDEFLSEQLQDEEIAREFLLSSMEGEDGVSLVEALQRTISIMGVKEFSETSGIHRNSVSRMLKEGITTFKNLDNYLSAFGLQSRISVEPKEVA